MKTSQFVLIACAVALTGCLQVSVLQRSDLATGQVGPQQTRIAFVAPAFTAAIGKSFSTGKPDVLAGKIANCKVSPALAAGLSINASTCEISGTATSLQGKVVYSVSFNDGAESGAVDVELEIAQVVPDLQYSSSTYTFGVGDASSTSGVPANLGGTIESCTVTPTLPPGLSLNATSCSISGTPTTVTAAKSYTITASNSAGDAEEVVLSLGVSNTAPHIAFGTFTYTFDLKDSASQTETPTSTAGAIAACAVSPALPAGLTVNQSNCRVSGTPSAIAASADYTLTPSNSVGAGVGVKISIEVRNVVPQIAFKSSSFTFNLKEASTTDLPISSKGAITGCIVTPSLPAGLSIDSTTCEVSGTPSAVASAATYTVTPSNAVGSGSSVSLTLGVANVVPSITYSSSSYAFNYNAAGVSTNAPTNSGGGITSCTVSPALPSGLSLSSTTCEISGKPVAVVSSTSYTVTASNSIGSGASRTISIAVNDVVPNLSYSTSSFTWNLNAPGSTTGAPTNTGGVITSCSVSPALPAGLSLNTSTCAISGTPSAVKSAAAYEITPTSSAGVGSKVTLTLAVANIAPSISFSSGVYAFEFTQLGSTGTPTNSGGAITGCTISPALPGGLSIHSTNCTISGTPTGVSAAKNYTVTATNSIGSSAKTVNLEVLNVVPVIDYGSKSFSFVAGDDTSLKVTNTGGAITGCKLDGNLPNGITFESSSCVITIQPAENLESTSYMITPSNEMGSGAAVEVVLEVSGFK